MKVFAVLILCLTAAAASPIEDIWSKVNRSYDHGLNETFGRPPVTGRIVGGVDADIEDFPYMLSLRRTGSHICGASVISDRWALSAAHCTFSVTSVTMLTLRGSTANRLEGGIIFDIESFLNHPQYNSRTVENDLCVLRTVQEMQGPNISPITLVPADTYYPGGTRAVVSGWGLTSVPGSLSVILQKVDIPVIDQATCRGIWSAERITDDMLCASEPGRQACNTDSGGPLITGGRQIGIVSWGNTDCLGNDPGVYARVAYPLLRNWVSEVTGV